MGARAAHGEIGERVRGPGPEPMLGHDRGAWILRSRRRVWSVPAVPATKTVTTQAPVLPAALGEDAGRHGAAIAAWPGAGIDEAELAAWEA